jgi:hypothetical protein
MAEPEYWLRRPTAGVASLLRPDAHARTTRHAGQIITTAKFVVARRL